MPKKKEEDKIEELEKKVDSMNLVLHEVVSFVTDLRKNSTIKKSGGLI